MGLFLVLPRYVIYQIRSKVARGSILSLLFLFPLRALIKLPFQIILSPVKIQMFSMMIMAFVFGSFGITSLMISSLSISQSPITMILATPFAIFFVLSLGVPLYTLSMAFHEFSHAFAAYLLGDKSPEIRKRLSLNPLKHMSRDKQGMQLWNQYDPVEINTDAFKSPVRDYMIAKLAGPFGSLLLVVLPALLAYVFRSALGTSEQTGLQSEHFIYIFVVCVCAFTMTINTIIALYNMIPIPAFDGGAILLPFVSIERFQELEVISNENLDKSLVRSGQDIISATLDKGSLGGALPDTEHFYINIIYSFLWLAAPFLLSALITEGIDPSQDGFKDSYEFAVMLATKFYDFTVAFWSFIASFVSAFLDKIDSLNKLR